MDKFRSFLFFFILFFPFSLFAQSYYFRNYSVDNGLPFIQVSAIYQDAKGNLWTGGYGGLSKFNGRSFINYSPKNGLIHHSVTCITEDRENNLWIGTINGVNKFSKDKFTSYTTANGLSDNAIRASLTDHEGKVWFATANGISIYNGQKFVRFNSASSLPSNDVISIYEDAAQVIWIGTSKGLSSFVNKKITNYSMLDGLPSNTIRAICGDATGNLWIGTANGLSVFRKEHFVNYSTAQGLPDNEITSVRLDAKANLWVGTKTGLCKIINTPSGITFKKYFPGAETKSNIINCLFTDYEGNFWVGTYNGLYRYRGDVFGLYAEKEGLKNTFIFQILRDKNKNLFVGTAGDGFYIYNGKQFSNYTSKNGLSGDLVNAATLDAANDLWIGTNKGLSKFDGTRFTNYGKKEGITGDSITAIYIDKKGIIWLGGNRVLMRFDGKRFESFDVKGPPGSFVSAITDDQKGGLWVGTYLGGLLKFDGHNFSNATEETGVKSNSVFSILTDGDDIFFATFDGVFLYRSDASSPGGRQKIHFSESDGLSSDLVYVLLFDQNGFLWAGTNQGINKINIAEFKKSGKKIIQPYGKEEGFQGVECNTNGAFKESTGNLWFGTVNGLIKYSPNEDFLNVLPPKTTITSIRLAERDTLLEDNCKLPYELNTIAFEFIGICLTNPNKVRYQYILEGSDKQWSAATPDNFVKYNLPPGHYVFQVRSCNNEGIWNAAPTTFTFTISPPFWKTWWFRILATILIASAIFLFIYFRIETVRKEERRRSDLQKRIGNVELLALRSQMNPHFIFNTMSSIQHFIANNEPDEALKYLSRFAKLMRAIMGNTKQPSITIHDELETLKLYLELEAMRFANKFEYSFHIDPGIDVNYEEIPSMLIQPYIENAIIHGLLPKSGNGKLTIDLTKKDNFIIATIEDNGVGRARARELNKSRLSQHRSLGMSITKERLSILNHLNKSENRLNEEVTDLFDEKGSPAGTRVVIYMPVESG